MITKIKIKIEEWICILTEVVVEGLEIKIVEKTKEKDEEVVRIIGKIKKVEVKILRGDEWESKDNLVLREGKMYILIYNVLRLEVI